MLARFRRRRDQGTKFDTTANALEGRTYIISIQPKKFLQFRNQMETPVVYRVRRVCQRALTEVIKAGKNEFKASIASGCAAGIAHA